MRICRDCGRVGPWTTKSGHALRCDRCRARYGRFRASHYQVATRLFGRPRGACSVCGSREDLTWGHIRPISKGGQTIKENLRVECRPCNSRKGNR